MVHWVRTGRGSVRAMRRQFRGQAAVLTGAGDGGFLARAVAAIGQAGDVFEPDVALVGAVVGHDVDRKNCKRPIR